MTLETSRRSVVVLAWRLRGENVNMAGSAQHTAGVAGRVYQFADVIVDLDRFELRLRRSAAARRTAGVSVLAYLLRHRDRLVDRRQSSSTRSGTTASSADSAITGRIKAAPTSRRVTTVNVRRVDPNGASAAVTGSWRTFRDPSASLNCGVRAAGFVAP